MYNDKCHLLQHELHQNILVEQFRLMDDELLQQLAVLDHHMMRLTFSLLVVGTTLVRLEELVQTPAFFRYPSQF